MSLSHSAGTALAQALAPASHREGSRSRNTALHATLITLVACLTIAILMSLSIALARPMPADGYGPAPEPMPIPMAPPPDLDL